MTISNKATLKTYFENGDVPTGQNYADFIDSTVNIAETAQQNMSGPLGVTELLATRVSATSGNFTGIVSAGTVAATTVSADSLYADNAVVSGVVNAQSVAVTRDVSAGGTLYASAMRSVNGFIGGVGIVSAAGSAQSTAAPLAYAVNRLQGVTDGSATGFAIPANLAGLVQHVYNETAASANIWPPVGGTINGLSADAPFGIAGNTAYSVIHLTASAWAVK